MNATYTQIVVLRQNAHMVHPETLFSSQTSVSLLTIKLHDSSKHASVWISIKSYNLLMFNYYFSQLSVKNQEMSGIKCLVYGNG